MTALTAILEQVKAEGISLEPSEGKLRVMAAPGKTIPETLKAELKAHKAELLDQIQTQNLKAALTRLELGETPAVRIRINDSEQVLILKDDEIPESITVNCPTFTMPELRKLATEGARPWRVAYFYNLKIGDPTMRITDMESLEGEIT